MRRKIMQLNNQELIKFLQQGGALVDIRRAEEWRQSGVVAESLLLTFFAQDGSSEPSDWLQQLNRLVSPERPLALICRSGYRTTLICDFLIEATDRRKICHLTEGILGWLAAGLPVVEIKNKQEPDTKSVHTVQ